VITVHVQPRASRTEVVGLHGDAVKIRLKAPPVDGAANEELVRFLADRLHIRRHEVELLSGATARDKRLRLTATGLTEDEVRARLLAREADS
jgi:uncharacterized protein (TIGR00251 family)